MTPSPQNRSCLSNLTLLSGVKPPVVITDQRFVAHYRELYMGRPSELPAFARERLLDLWHKQQEGVVI